jgi:ABC-type Zn uptake system ZnuABC Zn-binding protein ZnuA
MNNLVMEVMAKDRDQLEAENAEIEQELNSIKQEFDKMSEQLKISQEVIVSL